VILRRSVTVLGTLAIASMTLAMPSYGTTPGARKSKEGFTTPLTDDGAGSITIDPFHSKEMALSRRVGRGMARGCGGAVASRKQSRSDLLSGGWDSIWRFPPTTSKGSYSQLFLAYFSASVPAILEPNGLVPLSNHVLAWVLLTQRLPFDTAGISPGAAGTIPLSPVRSSDRT
jgi:hypothetical protein